MAQAGQWPDPGLMGQIVASGEEAVEPLRKLIRSRPQGWPAEAALVNAMGLLAELKSRTALPDLISVAREYLNESSREAGLALTYYGQEGFDALLGLIQESAVAGFQRTFLIDSAKQAAAGDLVRSARLAEVLRGLFLRIVEESKDAKAFEEELIEEESSGLKEHEANLYSEEELVPDDDDELADEDLGDEDWPGEIDDENDATPADRPERDPLHARHVEEAENELLPEEALGFLADDLCDLADPLAREMLESAFRDGLIDESIIGPGSIEESYRSGPQIRPAPASWLDEYRSLHHDHHEEQKRLASLPSIEFPSRTSYPSLAPDPSRPTPARPAARTEPIEPFRNTAPKIGRNDPCWCGSGKKYKKCHFGKDQPS
jgi:hypothetical protein